MGLAIIILSRLLFAASMVFIIGYIFGNFSRKTALTRLAKIGSITVIVLFIATNIALFRFGGMRHGHANWRNGCDSHQVDSTYKEPQRY